MRLLVCGDREWKDEKAIRDFLRLLQPDEIIHGGCKGADSIAHDIAIKLGIKVYVFKADWEQFGKKAGPIRNSEMLKNGKPDRVIAFHRNIAVSKGTLDMIRKAVRAGKEVWLVQGSL